MSKWLLLVISGFAIYGAIDSIRWLRMTRQLSAHELEKVVGYDGSHLSPVAREQRASLSEQFTLHKVVVMMVGIAVALVAATVRAFFS
jgi:hypothetical protein